MENGEVNLENRVAELGLNDSNSRDGLFQVMKAVEAAEATIKYQADESNRLRAALERTTKELEKLKSGDLKAQQLNPFSHYSNSNPGPPLDNEGVFGIDNRITSSITTLGKAFGNDSDKAFAISKDLGEHGHTEIHSDRSNGLLDVLTGGQVAMEMDVLSGGQVAMENIAFSEERLPPSTSFITRGYHLEGASNPQLDLSRRGQISVAEAKNSRSLKQDLALKIREHEEEILRLRKHLSEYSVKESQIRNEKFVLEKRIAYMRLAFDQQQQDLVDAASKAISYRQDIIEENIRLTYALQAAQQERSTFISSLMPLLAEYAFQPHVADAQTIVSHVKVLFRHMQEKLLVTEAKLKESQYQMAPWRPDVNNSAFSPSPAHSSGIKNGLELVPQPPYIDGKVPRYLDPQTTGDWDLSGHSQRVLDGIAKNAESDDFGRYSPLTSRNTSDQELAVHPGSTTESVPTRQKEDTSTRQVTFKDQDSNDMEGSDVEIQQDDREQPANWTSKSSAYATNIEDPSTSYSPYLPPVLEEPTSSFSEAGDDDPLPAIEGLQISGEAFPGRELQACGFSIYGTTSCNFEWVRHLDDGSFKYIDGAKQPLYLVTADDVNACLAIEVQPLDNRKRKGELVKVFANEHRKIICDPEMQACIANAYNSGHDSYKVSLLVGGDHLDLWEPALLSIKKDSYSIKCSGPSGVVASEKFSVSTSVLVPYGSPAEFSVVDRQGTVHRLRAESSSDDVSSFRDTIVLVFRFFVSKAIEKKKLKKRGLFFNK